MKRLLLLTLGCLLLGLGGISGVFGQKKDNVPNVPEVKEIPGLIAKLKDKDAGTRANAARLLGNRGQIRSRDIKACIPTLLDLVKSDPSTEARLAAATALGFASPDPKEALPILVTALKDDKDYGVRAAAATALGYFGPDGKDALAALREAFDIGKAAGKDEKDKRNLGKAAQGALQMISGSKKN